MNIKLLNKALEEAIYELAHDEDAQNETAYHYVNAIFTDMDSHINLYFDAWNKDRPKTATKAFTRVETMLKTLEHLYNSELIEDTDTCRAVETVIEYDMEE